MSVQIDLKSTPYEWEKIKYYYFSCETRAYLPHQENPLKQIIALLLSSAYLYVSNPSGSSIAKKQLAAMGNHIVTLLVEYFCWFSIEELNSEENEKFKERLNIILTYAQIHLREKVTSKKYFHRYFKHYWNTTPLQLKKWYRDYRKTPEEVCSIYPSEIKTFLRDYIADVFLKNTLATCFPLS